MPVGVVDPNSYERVELKSAPPDGYVMVRPLPYGLKLERRDKATKMSMEAASGKGKKQSQDDTQKIELETLSSWSTAYDFSHCIGEHNITDANGNVLELGNPMVLKLLNPKIGSELEKILSELNDDEDEESMEDFTKRLTSSSPIPTGIESEES